MKRCAMKLYRDGILSRPPVFQFCDRDTLRSLAAGSQLLVHCANVEVEGLSVLEALQQGIVPVIAKGRLCATSQFALDERSIFPEGDEKALAQRIDYWMEHPEERERTGRRYVEEAARYDIRESTRQLLEMFATASAGK
jgi:glycosyltransferase involved in cell wall biosynthesis